MPIQALPAALLHLGQTESNSPKLSPIQMLPSFRQRWIIVIATIIGALIWCQVAGLLESPSALSGISIFQAPINPLAAIILIILAGIPTLALGLFAASTANVLAGVFVISISLSALAGIGGGIRGFLFRSFLPGMYGWLIIEMIIWLIGLALVLLMLKKLGPKLTTKVSPILISKHFGNQYYLGFPKMQELLPGAICWVIAGVLTSLFMQASGAGQTIGSLILAFAIASFVTQLMLPQPNLVPVLISPGVVGIAAYAYMIIRYANDTQILAAYYTHTLPGIALVLPIFYISAGIGGTALGLGLAQAIEYTRHMDTEQAAE